MKAMTVLSEIPMRLLSESSMDVCDPDSPEPGESDLFLDLPEIRAAYKDALQIVGEPEREYEEEGRDPCLLFPYPWLAAYTQKRIEDMVRDHEEVVFLDKADLTAYRTAISVLHETGHQEEAKRLAAALEE